MANSTCSPSPQATTRQRMARRLCESATPIAMMSTSPMMPENRLQGDSGPRGPDGPSSWICAPGTVGGAWTAACAVSAGGTESP